MTQSLGMGRRSSAMATERMLRGFQPVGALLLLGGLAHAQFVPAPNPPYPFPFSLGGSPVAVVVGNFKPATPSNPPSPLPASPSPPPPLPRSLFLSWWRAPPFAGGGGTSTPAPPPTPPSPLPVSTPDLAVV